MSQQKQRLNIATLFTGGGIAFSRLRHKHNFVFACEYDAKIAEYYKLNYADSNCFVGRVQDVTPAMLIGKPAIDILQASPVCKEFSTAKVNGTESQEEISQAHAIANILLETKPRYFLLENVWQYREATSFKLILNRLDFLGYRYEYRHINCADYGVPQTRKRLILLAARADHPAWSFPEPTHEPDPTPTLWGTKERWVSWYEAIEDLIPTLPESNFAKWQLDRLPSELKENILTSGRNANQEWGSFYRDATQPAVTITDDCRLKIYLISGSSTSDIRNIDEPSLTIVSSPKSAVFKYVSNGIVLKLTPRALARLMSVPDDYILPEKAGLACTILGNGIPSLLVEKLIDALPVANDTVNAA